MLSELIFESESLNRVLDGHQLSFGEVCDLYQNSKNNPVEVFKAAESLRIQNKKRIVTFSKKAFFNLVNLCRDTCSYCTYKAGPGDQKLAMMSKRDVLLLSKLSKKNRCVEALFVTGERPESRYEEARRWLKDNGFSSTPEYLIHCSEIALAEGLFPHTNAGNLEKSEMRELQKSNASIGVMLENASERLSKKGMPHQFAPSKRPSARLQVLRDAGELNFPITTGLLIGIGETPEEVIESLFALKRLNQEFGHIQEIILQNFQPKPDTMMKDHPSAEQDHFKIMVALARLIMPQMNIQIPPNLSPSSYQEFLMAGINDWGGISPITPDYVNPEYSWPSIQEVNQNTEKAGFELKCRFPAYPEYFSFVNSNVLEKMKTICDENRLVTERYWR